MKEKKQTKRRTRCSHRLPSRFHGPSPVLLCRLTAARTSRRRNRVRRRRGERGGRQNRTTVSDGQGSRAVAANAVDLSAPRAHAFVVPPPYAQSEPTYQPKDPSTHQPTGLPNHRPNHPPTLILLRGHAFCGRSRPPSWTAAASTVTACPLRCEEQQQRRRQGGG